MLKRNITYQDFNGETVKETFYFNLTKTELIELELSYEGGLEKTIQRIIKAENLKEIVVEIKKIVLLCYGLKSEDGKRFIKSDEIRDAFSQSAAFDALFMELATNDEAASNFIMGALPNDLTKGLKQVETAPPLPPTVT